MRHLLVADLSKRFGNMHNGVNDIKTHRWFVKVDWKALSDKKAPAYYKPTVKYYSQLLQKTRGPLQLQ